MKENNEITFELETNNGLANAIRRSVNEIPSLAIEEVEFFKNDSALYDEIIAHRLGLVPLKNEKLKISEECSCKGEGCRKCQILTKMVKKGPLTIYSGDLTGLDVCYENMPITILTKNQELEFVAKAKTGKGTEHIKYSPGIIFYRNLLEINVGNKAKEISEVLMSCPNKCGRGSKIENNKTFELDICDSCEQKLKDLGLEIKDSNKLLFSIESFGQIPVKEVFIEAIGQLKKNLDLVSKGLKK